ncbi:GNAT family N-acetyltransferase [Stappia sp. BW2]|uniref:GNAT family N-acetyltransferase n=1 Tax=Stappia sp. BW2 TaxID=2592622 RepID=UPI0011DE8AEC|nr:GNAT family N-acetyltransferase [Stappia sp. BW2]TYC72288.1 GNAT family N-acetyltransferase [Stappia sp. BW2]
MDALSGPNGLTRAKSGDAEALRELARRAYEHYIPVIGAVPVPMTADYAAHVRNDEVWVLRSGNALAASLVLIRQPDHLLIESIAVDPAEQGKGHGRQLLDFARQRTADLQLAEIRLYTNILMHENRAWYQRAGFAETHEEQRGDKRIVHMRLSL